MSRAAQRANRAALPGCALLFTVLLLAVWAPPAADASPAQASVGSKAAGISIVNGRNASIRDWPWQVALTVSRKVRPAALTSRRYFCGGSILTPRLVLTAGHCVAHFPPRVIRQIEVVSGRTRLNSKQGQVVRVAGLSMPRDAAGKRRYRNLSGSADWDVALLRLAAPLAAEPIKLAGPDETGTWAAGQFAWTTGWGVTRPFATRVPAELKVAPQVVMGDRLCRRANGIAYRPATMLCAGGPGGNASACTGDSGGPLVVNTTAGYRLIGVTSFGDGACRGYVPSVDARVSAGPIRNWIAQTAMKLTGIDVLGAEGTAAAPRRWCRVPGVMGLRPAQARLRLEVRGCRLGQIRTDPWGAGRRGRIIGFSRYPDWLAPVGFRLNVWVAP